MWVDSRLASRASDLVLSRRWLVGAIGGLRVKLVRAFPVQTSRSEGTWMPGSSTAQRPTHPKAWQAGSSASPNASRHGPHAHSFSAVSCGGQTVAPPATRDTSFAFGQGLITCTQQLLSTKVIGSPQRAPPPRGQPDGPGKRTTSLATGAGVALFMTTATQHGHPQVYR